MTVKKLMKEMFVVSTYKDHLLKYQDPKRRFSKQMFSNTNLGDSGMYINI